MKRTRFIIRFLLLSVGCICCGILLACLVYDCTAVEGMAPMVQIRNSEHNEITLPYQLPGTEIIIRNFVSYEGAEDVSEILAVVLENTGVEWVDACNVQIFGDNATFTFAATMLPPGSRTLVIESARSKYRKVEVRDCCGQVSTYTEEQKSVRDIRVGLVDMGTIRIANTSNTAYSRIAVFYKAYDPESELYLDGIARKELVLALLPGEERMVCPAHYAGKYSRILILIAE